jgi:hypothetical protein
MHKHFADWYREAALEIDADNLSKRWQGIEDFIKPQKGAIDRATVLLQFFYGMSVDNEMLDRYREEFQKSDSLFPMRGNDFELRVLAGASIVHAIESKSQRIADAIALATVCGSYQGQRSTSPIKDVVNIASDYLRNRSASLRKTNGIPAIPQTKETEDFNWDNLSNQLQQSQIPAMATSLVPLLKNLAAWQTEAASTFGRAVQWLNHQIILQREESNILWWLFSGASRDLALPMSDLDIGFASLVAGREIANLVEVLPGPLAIEAFIQKTVLGSQTGKPDDVKLAAAVNAASPQWKKELANTDVSSIAYLCPVYAAIQKAVEIGGTRKWITAHEKACGISAQLGISPVKLGLQFYQENLLIRAIT